MLLVFLALMLIAVTGWAVAGFAQVHQYPTMVLVFSVATAAATAGWMITGFAVLASKRIDDVEPFWFRADVRAVGFALAICATLAAGLIGRWWWALPIFLVTPSLAALLMMALTRPVR